MQYLNKEANDLLRNRLCFATFFHSREQDIVATLLALAMFNVRYHPGWIRGSWLILRHHREDKFKASFAHFSTIETWPSWGWQRLNTLSLLHHVIRGFGLNVWLPAIGDHSPIADSSNQCGSPLKSTRATIIHFFAHSLAKRTSFYLCVEFSECRLVFLNANSKSSPSILLSLNLSAKRAKSAGKEPMKPLFFYYLRITRRRDFFILAENSFVKNSFILADNNPG